MIGDKSHTEATDGRRLRFPVVVGERSECCEAEGEPTVERLEVRMQT
jgi:hypothetical protein